MVVQELSELLDLVVWNLTVVKLRAGLTFKGGSNFQQIESNMDLAIVKLNL